jgi:hypothetical protein
MVLEHKQYKLVQIFQGGMVQCQPIEAPLRIGKEPLQHAIFNAAGGIQYSCRANVDGRPLSA